MSSEEIPSHPVLGISLGVNSETGDAYLHIAFLVDPSDPGRVAKLTFGFTPERFAELGRRISEPLEASAQFARTGSRRQ